MFQHLEFVSCKLRCHVQRDSMFYIETFTSSIFAERTVNCILSTVKYFRNKSLDLPDHKLKHNKSDVVLRCELWYKFNIEFVSTLAAKCLTVLRIENKRFFKVSNHNLKYNGERNSILNLYHCLRRRKIFVLLIFNLWSGIHVKRQQQKKSLA